MSLKYLIVFSLCLLTISMNTNAESGGETQAISNESREPEKNENLDSKPTPESKPEHGKVEVIEKGASYVVVRAIVKPLLDSVKFKKISLIYGIEKTKDKWVYSNEDAAVSELKINYKVVASKVVGDNYQYDMKVFNIMPDSEIKLVFVAIYGQKSVNLDEIKVKTLPEAPVIKVSPNLLTLQFVNPNAVKYFVNVKKIKDGKESDCILETTMSSCFGSSLGLPGLISGEKYSIEIWYIKGDNTESEHTKQEITA